MISFRHRLQLGDRQPELFRMLEALIYCDIFRLRVSFISNDIEIAGRYPQIWSWRGRLHMSSVGAGIICADYESRRLYASQTRYLTLLPAMWVFRDEALWFTLVLMLRSTSPTFFTRFMRCQPVLHKLIYDDEWLRVIGPYRKLTLLIYTWYTL